MIYFHSYNLQHTFQKFTPDDQVGIFYTPNTYAAHIMCDPIVSDICSIIKHESIFRCHTHMLHISRLSVHGLYTLTFYDVSTFRHMSTLYTHMLHISSDVETTPVSTWNRRPSPASRGYAVQWQCNWVTDSHKSNLLRILHKNLRCQQINSQFGSGLIKRLYELISIQSAWFLCKQRRTVFHAKVLPADDIARGLCHINKQAIV